MGRNTRKIPGQLWSKWITVWMVRLEYSFRFLNIPARLIVIGNQLVMIAALFKWKAETPFIIMAAGVLLFILFTWLVDKTKLREKTEQEAANRAGQWIELNKKLDKIEEMIKA